GESLGIVAVFEDLMEVERAERMEAWQEVARRIAHEVKNPLTPIQLSAQRLNKRLLPLLNKKEAQLLGECTGLILSQVEELKRLVGEFSMFARMPKSLKVPMRLDTLLREVLEVFRERHKEVIWRAVLPENGILVRGDREQLRRAITNILNNAVEAAPKEGEIFLSVSLYGDKVSISIEDSGPGIPPEFRHKVFEPYFSTKSQGGGLGLAISHSIIEDHHGEIWVEDSRLGGARVRIELPLEITT
ncbi:MAG: sensor histidine kinase, partial [Desulfatiglandales bacterium]